MTIDVGRFPFLQQSAFDTRARDRCGKLFVPPQFDLYASRFFFMLNDRVNGVGRANCSNDSDQSI